MDSSPRYVGSSMSSYYAREQRIDEYRHHRSAHHDSSTMSPTSRYPASQYPSQYPSQCPSSPHSYYESAPRSLRPSATYEHQSMSKQPPTASYPSDRSYERPLHSTSEKIYASQPLGLDYHGEADDKDSGRRQRICIQCRRYGSRCTFSSESDKRMCDRCQYMGYICEFEEEETMDDKPETSSEGSSQCSVVGYGTKDQPSRREIQFPEPSTYHAEYPPSLRRAYSAEYVTASSNSTVKGSNVEAYINTGGYDSAHRYYSGSSGYGGGHGGPYGDQGYPQGLPPPSDAYNGSIPVLPGRHIYLVKGNERPRPTNRPHFVPESQYPDGY